jgi:hypothetical protein
MSKAQRLEIPRTTAAATAAATALSMSLRFRLSAKVAEPPGLAAAYLIQLEDIYIRARNGQGLDAPVN